MHMKNVYMWNSYYGKMETGKLIKAKVQQRWQGEQREKGIRSGPTLLSGMYKKEEVHGEDPGPGEKAC